METDETGESCNQQQHDDDMHSRNETLSMFQEITKEYDVEKGIEMLEQFNWDLQKAIDAHMSIYGSNEHLEEGNLVTTANQDAAVVAASQSTAVSLNVVGNAHKMAASESNPWAELRKSNRKKANVVVASSSDSEKEDQQKEKKGKRKSTPVKSRKKAVANGAAQKHQTGSSCSLVSDSASEDGADTADILDTDMLVAQQDEGVRSEDRVPLIPTDCTSIEEALHNFCVVFESRYGAFGPNFVMGPLPVAIQESLEVADISQRRPLLIYLHDDNAVASHIFAQNVLACDPVASLVRNQFVTWGWDVTHEENMGRLLEWLQIANLTDILELVNRRDQPRASTSKDKYPLLILLIKEKATVTASQIITGSESSSTVLMHLMHVLDYYQSIKAQDMAGERERLEREQMRQEQQAEYEKSLEEDRARQARTEQQLALERVEQETRRLNEKLKQEREASLLARVPEEPCAEATDTVAFRIRVPNGDTLTRRFLKGDTVADLQTFIASQGYSVDAFRVWTSDRPRKDLETLDMQQTFADLKWSAREQLTVEEK